jgi:hypothetical protein
LVRFTGAAQDWGELIDHVHEARRGVSEDDPKKVVKG